MNYYKIRLIFRETVPGEIGRVIEELRANMSIFLTDQTDRNIAKTVMEELLSQVEEFSGKYCCLSCPRNW